MSRTLGDYDIWYKPCTKCGYDTGKSCQKENRPRCWKCGEHIERDFSDRALKDTGSNWKSRITKQGKQTHWINFNGKTLTITKDSKVDGSFLIILNCDYDHFNLWGNNREDIIAKLGRRKCIPKEIIESIPDIDIFDKF